MNVAQRTEMMMAETLTRDIQHQANRLKGMRESLTNFNTKREKAENQPATPAPVATIEPAKEQPLAVNNAAEKIILDWAKTHYKAYEDINQFPFEQYRSADCRITAGVVYLCLKKHSFIKQNETAEYRVMESYFKQNGRLADIARETGLTVWIVAKTIERLGFPPKWEEYRNSRYINDNRMGLSGEALFKRLVPEAVDANEDLRECNPVFDFIIHGKTVDVKEFAPTTTRSRASRAFWLFSPFHQTEADLADFYCLFLAKDKEKRLNGEYHCLLIPKEVLQIGKEQYQISTNPENNSYKYWMQFEVQPCALASMLSDEI